MAEREGFEPPEPLRVHVLSKHAHSTTLPPLRDNQRGRIKGIPSPAVNGNSLLIFFIHRRIAILSVRLQLTGHSTQHG